MACIERKIKMNLSNWMFFRVILRHSRAHSHISHSLIYALTTVSRERMADAPRNNHRCICGAHLLHMREHASLSKLWSFSCVYFMKCDCFPLAIEEGERAGAALVSACINYSRIVYVCNECILLLWKLSIRPLKC